MISGIVASQAGVGASVSTYLDHLAVQPRCAHGLRKLISTAALCVRVRNRTTGVETDIGFSGDSVSVAALNATFTGAEHVDVTKIYNQGGNANYDFVQTTVARMPNIVNAGAYNGTIKFTGAAGMETVAVLPFGTPQWGIYTRFNFVALATRVFIEMSVNASGANPQAAFIYSAAANRIYMYSQNGTGAARQNWTDCLVSMVQRTYLFDRSITGIGEAIARQAGVAQPMTNSGGSTEQSGNFNSYKVYLGFRGDNTLNATMDLDNLAQYDTVTTTLVDSIEGIIGAAP